MKKNAALLFVLLFMVSNAKAHNSSGSLLLQDIDIRDNVQSDIQVTIFRGHHRLCRIPMYRYYRTVVAVHGLVHTANTWQPFAKAILQDNPTGIPLCRVLAIDLPGHGGSSFPEGMVFGDLLLDDYIDVLDNVFKRLKKRGFSTNILLGHSQGALLLQLMQQSLITDGSSLRERFGARKVIMLAPSMPAPLPWFAIDSGAAADAFLPFFTASEALGTHLAIPDSIWPFFFFTDLAGLPVENMPSALTVTEQAYNALAPALSTFQLAGLPPFTAREYVDADVFSSVYGTRLSIIGYNNDGLSLPHETEVLYQYLSGDSSKRRYLLIEDSIAVHDMHVSDPNVLLETMAGKLRL